MVSEKIIALARQIFAETGNKASTAKILGTRLGRRIPLSTLKDWLAGAPLPEEIPLPPDNTISQLTSALSSLAAVTHENKILKAEIAKETKRNFTREAIRQEVFKLAEQPVQQPDWLVKIGGRTGNQKNSGVPTLFCSDWHWGEVVNSSEIGGFNSYNLHIAHKRVERLVERTISLLFDKLSSPTYDGLVLVLGGDMVTGDIHEELSKTNQQPIMPVVCDLDGVLVDMIEAFLARFERIHIPCVTGNHGRTTRKIQFKERSATNFEWLIYHRLNQWFSQERYKGRVSLQIPDGPDCYYHVYNHRYLLSHGDQFRGGDSMIGPIGPITRGRHKKHTRDTSMGMAFDTMLNGHFHTLMQLPHLVVNGCFPGYSNVITPNGPKQIKTIGIGDKIITCSGEVGTVLNKTKKQSHNGLVHLDVRGVPNILSATPNHNILAIKGEGPKSIAVGRKFQSYIGGGDAPQWIPIDYISPGDYVCIPYVSGDKDPITEDIAWAYGLYLAEGHTLLDGGITKNHHRIGLTMNKNELSVLQKFNKIFAKEFGMSGRVHLRKRVNFTSEFIISPGRNFCVKFRELFGHTASGKRCPGWFLTMSPRLKAAVVRGWIDGDGHRPKNGTNTSATTISPTLAWQMFQLALASGMFPSLMKLAHGGPRKSDSYTISFTKGQEVRVVDGMVFYRVNARYRDKKLCTVYDLEIDKDHTYCVEGAGVHNSLIGYTEYSYGGNFEAEKPAQALWITHPTEGITLQMPVYVDETKKKQEVSWVTIPKIT